MIPAGKKLALYMEGHFGGEYGKMGAGVLRYSPNPIACVIDSTKAGGTVTRAGTGEVVPIVSSIDTAIQLGSEVLILGIAPPGGSIPLPWFEDIDRAVEGGLCVVNGLHDLVSPRYPNLPTLPEAPQAPQWVWDVRIEPHGLSNGFAKAAAYRNRRILFIGTDMAVGKMTAGLEIHHELLARGKKAAFVATGQIGITITGAGIPLDAIRVDFASGAVEKEVVRHSEAGADIVLVEGQGSLVHPSSTANLPLLRGSCATDLILCVRAGQTHLRNAPNIAIPPLRKFIHLYEELSEACGTFPRAKTFCVAVNSSHLSQADAEIAIRQIEQETGLPATDTVRFGASKLVDAILSA